MRPARIAELLEPFVRRSTKAAISPAPCHSEERSDEESAILSPTQMQCISTYIDILLRWNARINLTAIRDPEEIVTRHFGESLFAARHLFPKQAHSGDRERAALQGRVPHTEETRALAPGSSANGQRPTTNDGVSAADLGSGAGFPGIPIKLWAPHLALTLIESNHKKTAFLREIVRALTLTNVNVFPGRAEQLLLQRPDPSLTSEEYDQPARTKPRRGQLKSAESDDRPQADQQIEPLPATNASGQSRSGSAGRFDLVTLRAVEHFASVLPVAASLLAPGGRLALLIGTSQLDRAQALLPTLSWNPAVPIPQSQSRTLLIARQS